MKIATLTQWRPRRIARRRRHDPFPGGSRLPLSRPARALRALWRWLPVLLAGMFLPGAGAAGDESRLLKLQAVPFTEVTLQDAFWAPRRETNRLVSIPFSLQKLEEAGNLEDIRLAARGATNGYRGPVFMDSDLYKALEAVAYSLATHPDPAATPDGTRPSRSCR